MACFAFEYNAWSTLHEDVGDTLSGRICKTTFFPAVVYNVLTDQLIIVGPTNNSSVSSGYIFGKTVGGIRVTNSKHVETQPVSNGCAIMCESRLNSSWESGHVLWCMFRIALSHHCICECCSLNFKTEWSDFPLLTRNNKFNSIFFVLAFPSFHLSPNFTPGCLLVVMRWCFRFPTAPLSVLPDNYLSGEGFVLLLDLELGRLQAQGFPRFHFLDAAIA